MTFKEYKYYPSKDIKTLCDNFAALCVDTNYSHYKTRNQTDYKKIIQDIKIGKLGEFAAYFYLSSQFKDLTFPDLNIYSKNNKSFSADLSCKLHNFHIKCQNEQSSNTFGSSWMFQIEDKLISTKDKKDIFVGLKVSNYITIQLIKPIIELKFSPPKLNKLKDIKTVVYLNENV